MVYDDHGDMEIIGRVTDGSQVLGNHERESLHREIRLLSTECDHTRHERDIAQDKKTLCAGLAGALTSLLVFALTVLRRDGMVSIDPSDVMIAPEIVGTSLGLCAGVLGWMWARHRARKAGEHGADTVSAT